MTLFTLGGAFFLCLMTSLAVLVECILRFLKFLVGQVFVVTCGTLLYLLAFLIGDLFSIGHAVMTLSALYTFLVLLVAQCNLTLFATLECDAFRTDFRGESHARRH